MGHDTTDENQLNAAGRQLFGGLWQGVFAADELPPRNGYSIQNTMPRSTRTVGHWLARANDAVYDSYGRKQYGDFSGDAEQKLDENCCGQMCLAWLCVYKDLGQRAARLI